MKDFGDTAFGVAATACWGVGVFVRTVRMLGDVAKN